MLEIKRTATDGDVTTSFEASAPHTCKGLLLWDILPLPLIIAHVDGRNTVQP